MAKFEQRRRFIPIDIQCQSEVLYHYLNKSGGILIGAVQRIAQMYLATEHNADYRKVVEDTFKPIFDELNSSYEEFHREARVLRRKVNKKKQAFPTIVAPDSHTFTVELTHPIFNDLVSVIKKLDNSMSIIETLWMIGFLREEQYLQAKPRVESILKRFERDVYSITNRLRSLGETRGNTVYQINSQIKGAMTQTPDVEEQAPETAELVTDTEQQMIVASDDNPIELDDVASMIEQQNSDDIAVESLDAVEVEDEPEVVNG